MRERETHSAHALNPKARLQARICTQKAPKTREKYRKMALEHASKAHLDVFIGEALRVSRVWVDYSTNTSDPEAVTGAGWLASALSVFAIC